MSLHVPAIVNPGAITFAQVHLFCPFLALLRSICCGAKPADLFDEAKFTRAVHTIFVKKRSSVCHH
jgi:hypothetical protein